MRHQFIAGNWKMNGDQASITALINNIKKGLKNFSTADVVVFPSFVYLTQVHDLLKNTNIAFGAQNFSQHEKGAYTGEISPLMLRNIGCQYVLVGHSERRQLYEESSILVAEKFSAALKYGLTPVLCVGETLTQREEGKTESVVLEQINTVINYVGIEKLADSIIAYEPVWAIGTGLTATPEQAQTVHDFIRKTIVDHDAKISENLRIVYGGSVKANNAKDLFTMPDIDGGLIGGASLKAPEFINICQAASE